MQDIKPPYRYINTSGNKEGSQRAVFFVCKK
nr:MAG TPA: hypothetical protein [Caudoviricetes sp.]